MTDWIRFHPVPRRSLEELFDEPQFTLSQSPGQWVTSGTIDTQHQEIGRGAFKTCHMGILNLGSKVSVPAQIGHISNQTVAVKRFYVPDAQESNTGRLAVASSSSTWPAQPAHVIRRYSAQDELPKILGEANLLYWCHGLMDLMKPFMERENVKMGGGMTPFVVPDLQFVDGAVAVAPSDLPQTPWKRVLLIEQYIDSGVFVKYVGNGMPRPLMGPGEPGYDIALYLCFVQHTQYEKTGRLAYISDFQGEFTPSACTIMTLSDWLDTL